MAEKQPYSSAIPAPGSANGPVVDPVLDPWAAGRNQPDSRPGLHGRVAGDPSGPSNSSVPTNPPGPFNPSSTASSAEPAESNPLTPVQTPDQFPGSAPDVVQQRLPYWLRQAERFLRVIVRIYLGLLVCFAPWVPLAWDANPLFAQSPWLMSTVTNGAVRGLVSGLGLLNLWIALRDALRSPTDRETGTR